MPPWLRHGWREFRQSWRQVHRRVPGGRDFLSLTLIYLLVIGTILLGLAANRGFASSFADSLIGSLRGWGVPIWVTADLGRIRKGLDPDVLAEFGNWPDSGEARPSRAFPDLAIHPLREIEPSSPLLRFLDAGSWRAAVGGSAIEFRGWAVGLDSPLWRWAMNAAADRGLEARTIVLNKAIVLSRWNYEAYRASLRGQIPDAVIDAMPATLEEPAALDAIYLRAALSGTRGQIARFRVVWADSLPVLQKIAFLLPLETATLLDLNFQFDGIRWVPPMDGEDRLRVRDVVVSNVDRLAPAQRARVDDGLACIGAGPVERGPFDVKKSLTTALPEQWIVDCMRRNGVPLEVGLGARDLALRTEERPAYQVRGGRVAVPCSALPMDRVPSDVRAACAGRGESATVEVAPIVGYPSAYVYVPDRASLFRVKERLTAFRSRADGTQVFYLAEAYQDALDRFFYLSEFIAYVAWPLAISGLVFLTYVMGVFLHSILARRRVFYGVMLARGFTVADVRRIVFVQLGLSAAIGGAIAIAACEAVKILLDGEFARSALAAFARSALGIRDPVLMPHVGGGGLKQFASEVADMAATGCVVTMAVLLGSLALCEAVLRVLPLKSGTAPIDLMIVTQPDDDAGR